MALTHTTAVRNVLADATVDAIDAGATDTTGDLIIMTSGDVEVATLTWTATPAFGAASGGTATMNAINDDTSATGGTAALFKFQNRDNVEIFRGTVTATGGGGDLTLSSTSVGATDTVSITSFTYSASA
jgi:hypothetical protein